MARHHYRRIEWTADVPEGRDLERLRELLSRLDGDAPVYPGGAGEPYDDRYPGLGPWGLSATWRAPLLTLQQTLNIAHVFGYPCRGWEVRRVDRNAWDGPEDPQRPGYGLGWQGWVDQATPGWVASRDDLRGCKMKDRHVSVLRRFSRRFDGYLPLRTENTMYQPKSRAPGHQPPARHGRAP